VTDAATAVIADYVAAWNCPDPAARTTLLNASWAPEATYTDPTVALCGAAELQAHIAARQAQRPGAVIELVGGVAAHHDWASFRWRARMGETTLVSGFDCVQFAADGRLRCVVGFFDVGA
jgi:hypothetical protein